MVGLSRDLYPCRKQYDVTNFRGVAASRFGRHNNHPLFAGHRYQLRSILAAMWEEGA